MQSVELQAVTQARASGDYHPGSNQWQVGISSIFADALAIRPTKDNFWSVPTESNGKVPGTDQCEAPYNNSCGKLRGYGLVTEPFNRLQAAVSTLTAGPVAPSDAVGKSDAALILRSCMSDGTLLQPDRPARMLDSAIAAAAFGDAALGPSGQVWATESAIGEGETAQVFRYLFAAETSTPFAVGPDALGAGEMEGKHVAFEVNGTKSLQAFDAEHPIKLGVVAKYNFNLWTIAPVLEGGWALLGEAQTKWVAVSAKRFTRVDADSTSLTVQMRGEAGESVEVWIVPPAAGQGEVAVAEPVSVGCVVSGGGTAVLRAERDGARQTTTCA